jgi:hypothetical protein
VHAAAQKSPLSFWNISVRRLTPKPVLGGKSFFFFNYQALRFPNFLTFEKPAPSAALRQGRPDSNATGTQLPETDIFG